MAAGTRSCHGRGLAGAAPSRWDAVLPSAGLSGREREHLLAGAVGGPLIAGAPTLPYHAYATARAAGSSGSSSWLGAGDRLRGPYSERGTGGQWGHCGPDGSRHSSSKRGSARKRGSGPGTREKAHTKATERVSASCGHSVRSCVALVVPFWGRPVRSGSPVRTARGKYNGTARQPAWSRSRRP
jgi:hypothetical protein